MTTPKKFTYAEIKALNVDKKVWIVIDDKVYNISSFLEEVSFFVLILLIDNFRMTEIIAFKQFNKLIASWWTGSAYWSSW